MKKMVMKLLFALLIIPKITSASTSIDLVDNFPTYQGENGFYAQTHQYYKYAAPLSSYDDMIQDVIDPLTYRNRYGNDPLVKNLPLIQMDTYYDRIILKTQGDPIYNVTDAVYTWDVNQSGTYHITGQFSIVYLSIELPILPTVRIYIDDAYDKPLYQCSVYSPSVNFDITIPNLCVNQKIRFALVDRNDGNPSKIGLTGTITKIQKDQINLVNDYPTFQGENGFYAQSHQYYDKNLSPASIYANMVQDSADPLTYASFLYPSTGRLPLIQMNQNHDKIIFYCPGNPKYNAADAVYTWVVNQSGSYRLTGQFFVISSQLEPWCIPTVRIYIDDAYNQPLYQCTVYSPSVNFDITIPNLYANQKIRFALIDRNDGNASRGGLAGSITHIN